MTENDFLVEYRNRFLKLINNSIKTIQDNKNLHYNILFEKYVEINSSISYLGNILISDIMNDFNLDPNQKSLDGFTLVHTTGVLLRKSFGIQLELGKTFDDKVLVILNEVLCRDFPQNCQE